MPWGWRERFRWVARPWSCGDYAILGRVSQRLYDLYIQCLNFAPVPCHSRSFMSHCKINISPQKGQQQTGLKFTRIELPHDALLLGKQWQSKHWEISKLLVYRISSLTGEEAFSFCSVKWFILICSPVCSFACLAHLYSLMIMLLSEAECKKKLIIVAPVCYFIKCSHTAVIRRIIFHTQFNLDAYCRHWNTANLQLTNGNGIYWACWLKWLKENKSWFWLKGLKSHASGSFHRLAHVIWTVYLLGSSGG